MLYVRLSDELKKRLADFAAQRDLPVSAAARMLIKQALDREDTHDDRQNP